MSASNEWQERHLTPGGWVDGSYRVDAQGLVEVPTPDDRVLTSRYTETWSFGMPSIDKRSEIVWRSEDKALISELLTRYGNAPDGL